MPSYIFLGFPPSSYSGHTAAAAQKVWRKSEAEKNEEANVQLVYEFEKSLTTLTMCPGWEKAEVFWHTFFVFLYPHHSALFFYCANDETFAPS